MAVGTKMKSRRATSCRCSPARTAASRAASSTRTRASGKVIVENLNVATRHQKPRPMRDASRMGGPQMIPGGIIDRPTAVPVGNVMVVCPTCKLPTRVGYTTKEIKGETVKVRVCKRDRLRPGASIADGANEDTRGRDVRAAPEAALQRRAPRRS